MPSGDVYSVVNEQSNPGTDPLIEITAHADYPVEIQRVTVTERSGSTSQVAVTNLTLLTSASSGGTAITPEVLHPGASASGATVKYAMGSIGTQKGAIIAVGWNLLAGFFYYPVEDERAIVARSGIFAVRFPVSPPTGSYNTTVVFKEL